MKIGRLASIALVAVAWTHAAAADDAALRQQVSALEQMVLDLQARVAYLEGQTPAAPQAAAKAPEAAIVVSVPETTTVASVPQPATVVSAPPPAPASTIAQSVPAAAAPAVATPHVATGSGYVSEEAALRANWAKVAKQMNEGEVTTLLGDPSSKSTLDGRTVWYYLYPGTGRGSVFFTDNGRVSSRQSPFGLGW